MAATTSSSKQKPSKNKGVLKTSGAVKVLVGGRPATGLYVVYTQLPPEPDGEAKGFAKVIQDAVAGRRLPYALGIVDAGGYVQDVKPNGNPWAYLKNTNPHSDKLMEGMSYSACLVAHPDPAFARAMQVYLTDGTTTDGITLPKEDKLNTILQKLTVEAVTGKKKELVVKLPVEGAAYWPPGSQRYGKWNLYAKMPYAHLESVKTSTREMMLDLAALRFPVGISKFHPYRPDAVDKMDWRIVTAAIRGFQLEVIARRAFKVGALGGSDLRALAAKKSAPGRSGAKSSWAYLLGQSVKLAEPKKSQGTAASPAPADASAVAAAVPAAAAAVASVLPAGATPAATAKPATSDPVELKCLFGKDDVYPGVVDQKTGDAIAEWLEKDLRKDNPILVELWGNMDSGLKVGKGDPVFFWGRSELALAIEAWRDLCVVLGCLYGISLAATFRELMKKAEAESGAVETSRHKLGISVDLYNSNSRRAPAGWPIQFEVEWKATTLTARKTVQGKLQAAKASADAALPHTTDPLEAAKLHAISKMAEADLARLEQKILEAQSGRQPWWRLYGHSILDIDLPAAEFVALVLQRLGWTTESTECGFVTKHMERLVDYTGASNKTPELAGFTAPLRAKLQKTVNGLVSKLKPPAGPGLFLRTFFRKAIQPFVINGFDVLGGFASPAILASSDSDGVAHLARSSDPYQTAKVKGKPPAKSWLNVSRLGYECEMLRIPGQTNKKGFHRPDADTHLGEPMTWEMMDLASSHLKDSILPDIRSMSSAAKHDPDMKEYELFLTGKDDAGKEQVRSMTIEKVDQEFLEQWSKEVKQLREAARKAPVYVEGADVLVEVANPAATAEEAISFCKSHANRAFRACDAVGRFPDLLRKGELLTGAEIRKRLDKLAEDTKKKGGAKDQTESTSRSTDEYTMKLRPIFEVSPSAMGPDGKANEAAIFFDLDTGKQLAIPARGRPGKYEWWHFDHVVHHKKNWIDLGGEIGYSPDALSAPEAGEKPFWNGGIGYADPDIKERIFGKLENGAPGNGDTSTVASSETTLEAAEEGNAGEQAPEESGE